MTESWVGPGNEARPASVIDKNNMTINGNHYHFNITAWPMHVHVMPN